MHVPFQGSSSFCPQYSFFFFLLYYVDVVCNRLIRAEIINMQVFPLGSWYRLIDALKCKDDQPPHFLPGVSVINRPRH